jgi:hypothetical protein
LTTSVFRNWVACKIELVTIVVHVQLLGWSIADFVDLTVSGDLWSGSTTAEDSWAVKVDVALFSVELGRSLADNAQEAQYNM